MIKGLQHSNGSPTRAVKSLMRNCRRHAKDSPIPPGGFLMRSHCKDGLVDKTGINRSGYLECLVQVIRPLDLLCLRFQLTERASRKNRLVQLHC